MSNEVISAATGHVQTVTPRWGIRWFMGSSGWWGAAVQRGSSSSVFFAPA